MAYKQWVSITINPIGFEASIKNAALEWGKFYADGDKDHEISADTINTTVIQSQHSATINSCGRENASSGTKGSFEIYDGARLVGTYYWDCPWGSSTNISNWVPNDKENYVTQASGGNLESGALGNVTIKSVKIKV